MDSEIDIPRTKKRRFSKTKKLPKERNRFLDISLGPVKRRSWTIAEREAVKKYFKDEFVEKLLPSTEQCLAAIQTCPELNSRTPKQLKSWVHNQISQIRGKQLCQNVIYYLLLPRLNEKAFLEKK